MWLLIIFGIGIFILVQVIDHKGLTNWQDPITRVVWIYLIIVFIYITFLNAVPMAWNYFKEK